MLRAFGKTLDSLTVEPRAQDNLRRAYCALPKLVERRKPQLRAVKPVTVTPNWPAPMHGTPMPLFTPCLISGIRAMPTKRTLAY